MLSDVCIYFTYLVFVCHLHPPLFISPRVPRSWSDGFPVRRMLIEECVTAMKRCSTSETTAPVCQKEASPPFFAPACYSVQMRDVIGCGRCVSQPPLMVASLAPEEA